MIVTHALARRLDAAEMLDAAACAEACARAGPEGCADIRAVGGGVAVYCGPASPLTHALGIGIHGPVRLEDVLEIEHFFRTRGSAVVIDVSPYADPTLVDVLGGRHYRVAEFTNVMVRRIDSADAELRTEQVRRAARDERDLFTRTVSCGFFSRDEVSEEELGVTGMLFDMPGGRSYFALADGAIAGGSGMSVRNRVASFYGDATLLQFRGRGIHSAMIRGRLAEAAAEGAEYATAGTLPSSTSQHNYQRLGFEVAYTKATMVKE